MRVFTKRRLREFWEEHPEAYGPLDRGFRIAEKADWRDFASVRTEFPQADLVSGFLVFNIGGNKYRLVVGVDFRRHSLFIRAVLTHAEYDEGDWKS